MAVIKGYIKAGSNTPKVNKRALKNIQHDISYTLTEIVMSELKWDIVKELISKETGCSYCGMGGSKIIDRYVDGNYVSGDFVLEAKVAFMPDFIANSRFSVDEIKQAMRDEQHYIVRKDLRQFFDKAMLPISKRLSHILPSEAQKFIKSINNYPRRYSSDVLKSFGGGYEKAALQTTHPELIFNIRDNIKFDGVAHPHTPEDKMEVWGIYYIDVNIKSPFFID